MRRAEAYSLTQVSDASWILATKDRLAHGTLVQWAVKVIRWWKAFRTVVGLYSRYEGNGGAVALKAVWQNIRNGVSPYRMIRDHVRATKPQPTYRKTSKHADPDAVQSIRPARGKWSLHAKRRRQVEAQELSLNR